VNASSTLANTTIWFVAALSLIVDVRMYVCLYVRTDRHFTGFIRPSLRRWPKNGLIASEHPNVLQFVDTVGTVYNHKNYQHAVSSIQDAEHIVPTASHIAIMHTVGYW